MGGMVRPCYLVIDREFPGSISTRKLVIETAKFNVITAYSGVEARETCERFPSISGAVIDARLEDIPCAELVRDLKAKLPELQIIVVCAPGDTECPDADFVLDSFEPAKLLEILRKLNPEASDIIEKRNEEMSWEKLR